MVVLQLVMLVAFVWPLIVTVCLQFGSNRFGSFVVCKMVALVWKFENCCRFFWFTSFFEYCCSFGYAVFVTGLGFCGFRLCSFTVAAWLGSLACLCMFFLFGSAVWQACRLCDLFTQGFGCCLSFTTGF